MQALVEKLIKKAGTSGVSKDFSDSLPREMCGARRQPCSLSSTNPGIPTPTASGVGDPAYPGLRRVNDETVVRVSCCNPSARGL